MADYEIEVKEIPSQVNQATIKAIGVGGGGGNMINHMVLQNCTDIDLIVANTDAQALNSSVAPIKIQLGQNATRGLGAGMKPEKGKEAAIESFEEIKKLLEGSDIVFISAGLGGGTGTGAAPIIAKAAKEIGALTVAIVTNPFRFEGRRRTKLAEGGLAELKEECDSIIVVPNDKLLQMDDKKMGLKDSFKLVDEILAQAVGGISKIILSHGANDINVDFADVETIMSHKGLALMGSGFSSGENAAHDALKLAIESPLLDNVSINGAMGVLVHFHIHPSYPIQEISDAMDIVYDSADEDVYIIFGSATDENMKEDEVKITIVATGFENKETPAKTLDDVLPKGNHKIIMEDSANKDDLDIPTYLRNKME